LTVKVKIEQLDYILIINRRSNSSMAQLTTLQIATFGEDMQEGIAAGIRNFPVHRLTLICYGSDHQKAEEFARRIRTVLGIPVTIAIVNRESVIRDVLERIGEILSLEGKKFQQILLNVSCGDKLLGCAGLSAAFINGIKAFGMDSEGAPLAMPVLKLSYSEIISEPKLKILKAVEQVGGAVDSLEKLEEASGFGKPLLSYHIMGGKEARGLAELGLVEVEKGDRGKLLTKLTTLGKLLVLSGNGISTTQQQK
jgi:PII-like signaling protein